MSTRSPWFDARVPNGAELDGDLSVEVCVIGAGITGLSVAYQLVREGRRVAVLDRGPIGGGETGRTTAHLASALDDRFHRLAELHGHDGLKLAVHSHRAAIDWIESFISREGLDCDFQRLDGYLLLGDGQDPSILDKELQAAERAGLDGVSDVGEIMLGVGPRRRALRFTGQAELHPMRYLAALALAVQREGGVIYTGAHVTAIEQNPTRVLVKGGHTVRCDQVVVATNAPISSRVAIHTKLSPHRTYVVALRIPGGIAPPALFWDTEEPYHYMRKIQWGQDDVILIGGADHKTGQAHDAPARWAQLEQWGRERFPEAQEVTTRWSGQVLEPVDGLAYIGPVNDEDPILVATGDSGHGMTHGTVAGMLIGAILAGRESPWRKLYDPRRLAFRAMGTYAKENLNAFGQYRGWLEGAPASAIAELAPRSGTVVRRGLELVAVYKDAEGRCHHKSAVCPHLGSIVTWNAAEETWDCPSHGSRFDGEGRLVCGPANTDLSPADDVPAHTDPIAVDTPATTAKA